MDSLDSLGRRRRRPVPQPLALVSVENALLTTETASVILGVHAKTLQRMAARGEITPVRIGKRCTRWPAEAVRALAARSTSQQGA